MTAELAALVTALHSASFTTDQIADCLNGLAIAAPSGFQWLPEAVSAVLPLALTIATSCSNFSALPNPLETYRHVLPALRETIIKIERN